MISSERPYIILGAGVIGLTTAVRLLESPYYQSTKPSVHIIADHLPNDPLDARYASTIAGAHHLSFADDIDERQRGWDRKTFQIMYEEWREIGESSGLMALKQTELFVGETKHLKIYEEHPDFAVLDERERPKDVDHSVSFTSLTMTPLIYLNRLLKRIDDLSNHQVKIHRHHLPSLSALSHPSIHAMIGTAPPLAIIVCTGIGALTLGDVEDKTVYPTRGQVVKVRAPWIRAGYTRQVGSLTGSEGGERTYVIPRPDGEVILGGTREVGDWYPYPREGTTSDILKRVLEICPDLCPSHMVAPPLTNQKNGSIETLKLGDVDSIEVIDHSPLRSLIVDTLVGFRPSREGGTRLERGQDLILVEEQPTAVVYNYGHGGAGWQSCWGTAEDAVALLLATIET
ncbi:hypothetical protein CI109_105768 [Kwoniella shandongensis]|uniref:Uncharacterized protein n=1 Tax=Kwoniella shandongensis TaxID=1734106 RepID=A0A5M6C515_9TREE|nr:uncharacterized protein CI109_003107 [Kwoniella shandongensis]KAA5528575.1 hypothetical protein CI109_003107 [Kwoniella shandongensis]